MTIYGTPEHEDLVMEVLTSKQTVFLPKSNAYISLYFTVRDPQNFKKHLEDSNLEVFTELVRIASAKYLEMQNIKEF